MEAFEKELTHLINRHSIENMADMPDFLLAGMICRMIEAMGPSIKKTLDWHGCDSVCHPSPNAELGGTGTKQQKYQLALDMPAQSDGWVAGDRYSYKDSVNCVVLRCDPRRHWKTIVRWEDTGEEASVDLSLTNAYKKLPNAKLTDGGTKTL
jgi:hypothetical protein